MVGARAAAARRVLRGGAGRGAKPPQSALGRALRTAAQPGRLRVGNRRCLPPAECGRRAEFRPGGGRNGGRQDSRLYRTGQRVGGEERGAGLALYLYPQSATPDRSGTRPALSRPRVEKAPCRGAQGARELSLPAKFGGGGARGWRAPGRRGRPRSDGPLGGAHPGRRFDRRGFPVLAGRFARRCEDARSQRPSRRMHLLCLPALSEMLYRAGRAPGAAGRPCDRKPCLGDGAGGTGRARQQ